MSHSKSNSKLDTPIKKRNFAILVAIAAWCVLIWIVTMIKVGNGG